MPKGKYEHTQRDLSGIKFGRLTGVKFVGRKKTIYYWLFKCDCGTEKVIRKNAVLSGMTRSCGCFLKESSGQRTKTHGMHKERFYRIWRNILGRCKYICHVSYKDYGGRGIKVLWTSFESFRDDMYESYLKHVEEFGEKQTTIERINNDGHYEPSNCKWVNREEQARNKRTNCFFTIDNETKTLKDWSLRYNISYDLLYARIYRSKWSIKKALTVKPIIGRNKHSFGYSEFFI